MEERMEYHLEERMRDVHELLENCQNRVSKRVLLIVIISNTWHCIDQHVIRMSTRYLPIVDVNVDIKDGTDTAAGTAELSWHVGEQQGTHNLH